MTVSFSYHKCAVYRNDLGLWVRGLGLVFCLWSSPEFNFWLLAASNDSTLLVSLITLLSKALCVHMYLGTHFCPGSWVSDWFNCQTCELHNSCRHHHFRQNGGSEKCGLTLFSQVPPSWRQWKKHRFQTYTLLAKHHCPKAMEETQSTNSHSYCMCHCPRTVEEVQNLDPHSSHRNHRLRDNEGSVEHRHTLLTGTTIPGQWKKYRT